MRRVFKLAVVVGGIGALAWGVRKRFRVAIGRSGAAEPNFQINEPSPEEPAGEMSAEAEEGVNSHSCLRTRTLTTPGPTPETAAH